MVFSVKQRKPAAHLQRCGHSQQPGWWAGVDKKLCLCFALFGRNAACSSVVPIAVCWDQEGAALQAV